MNKQMCWHQGSLWISESGQWISYRNHPLKQADDSLTLSMGVPSKGWRTMQYLLKHGYKLVNSEVMNNV